MHNIKLRRAARLSHLAQYPRTWAALLQRIPVEVVAVLTSRQIAAMADALHAQYTTGHTAGWQDAQ